MNARVSCIVKKKRQRIIEPTCIPNHGDCPTNTMNGPNRAKQWANTRHTSSCNALVMSMCSKAFRCEVLVRPRMSVTRIEGIPQALFLMTTRNIRPHDTKSPTRGRRARLDCMCLFVLAWSWKGTWTSVVVRYSLGQECLWHGLKEFFNYYSSRLQKKIDLMTLKSPTVDGVLELIACACLSWPETEKENEGTLALCLIRLDAATSRQAANFPHTFWYSYFVSMLTHIY